MAVILYTRSLGIDTAKDHRRFWDQNVDTFHYYAESMSQYYGKDYQKMVEEEDTIIDDAIYVYNKEKPV